MGFIVNSFFSSGPSWIMLIPSGHLSHMLCICWGGAIFQMMVLIQPWCIKYFPSLCNVVAGEGGFVSPVSARTSSARPVSPPVLTSESLSLARLVSDPFTYVFGFIFPSVYHLFHNSGSFYYVCFCFLKTMIFAVFLDLILQREIIHICKSQQRHTSFTARVFLCVQWCAAGC